VAAAGPTQTSPNEALPLEVPVSATNNFNDLGAKSTVEKVRALLEQLLASNHAK
jgi:hypothetical protein